MTVKRYTASMGGGQEPDGCFVMYDDYAAIKKERVRADELNKQVVNLAVENAGLKAWADNRAASDDSFEQEQYPTLKIDWRQRHLKTLQTPATCAAIANIQAQGVEKFAQHPALGIIACGHIALEFATQLRKEQGK